MDLLQPCLVHHRIAMHCQLQSMTADLQRHSAAFQVLRMADLI